MFFIDIPFKGCQSRSNRSSIMHAVSYFACKKYVQSFLPENGIFKKINVIRKGRNMQVIR
jgi:hypothetical protein